MLNFTPNITSKYLSKKSRFIEYFTFFMLVINIFPILYYYNIIFWPIYITVIIFWVFIILAAITIITLFLVRNNNFMKLKLLSTYNLPMSIHYNLIIISISGYFLFMNSFAITAIMFLTFYYIIYIHTIANSLRIYYERRKYRKKYNT